MLTADAHLANDLGSACQRWAHRPATTGGGITWTYRELGARVAKMAKSYRELGIAPGDRVVCGLRDRPELVAAVHAAWACGAIHVGVHNDLTGPELVSVVERTGAAAVVFQPGRRDDDPLAPLAAVARAAPGTRRIVLDAPVRPGECSLAEMLDEGSSHSDIPPPPPAGTLPVALFLTSGTTGRPKAAVETFPALLAKVRFFADSVGPGPDDVHLMYLPMAHAFGLKLSLLALLSGGHLVLLERFAPEAALASITEHQVTVLPGTPTHFTLLLDALDERRHQVGSLRWGVSAAAPFSRELAQRVYDRLGIELLSVYGCSEGFLVTTTRRDDIVAGSVGSSVFRGPPGSPPSGSVQVVDLDDGTPLPAGKLGEIRFSTSAPVRYWGEPAVAVDGWYRSGDIGRIDPDGRLYIVGRTKDVINRGGLKVSSGEVEAALCQHPRVSDGAVVAAPDPVLGEAICACVVPAGPTIPTLAELRSFLGVGLARHKLPDELCLVQEIPRSPIGKLDRRALHEAVVGADLARERLRPR